jgi:dethiobiotin synthetase
MNRAYFLTGTDTDAGKTFVTCALLDRARRDGLRAAGLKPVAAGTDAQWRNDDIERIVAASSAKLPAEVVNQYCFAAAVAPHLAAAEENRPIRFAPMLAACEQARQQTDLLIVEGVGGFRVPLGPDGDSADLAVALALPVILVVGLRLGCLNHALLTVEAIASRGLALAGWVANSIDPAMNRREENLASLRQLIQAPLLGVMPHGPAVAADHVLLPES